MVPSSSTRQWFSLFLCLFVGSTLVNLEMVSYLFHWDLTLSISPLVKLSIYSPSSRRWRCTPLRRKCTYCRCLHQFPKPTIVEYLHLEYHDMCFVQYPNRLLRFIELYCQRELLIVYLISMIWGDFTFSWPSVIFYCKLTVFPWFVRIHLYKYYFWDLNMYWNTRNTFLLKITFLLSQIVQESMRITPALQEKDKVEMFYLITSMQSLNQTCSLIG